MTTRVLCDDVKGCPMDFSILFLARLNKNRLSRITELENTLIQLQAQQEVGFSEALQERIT